MVSALGKQIKRLALVPTFEMDFRATRFVNSMTDPGQYQKPVRAYDLLLGVMLKN